ncbi:hypothetical protein ACJIZ3_021485 [Penstemon smallii]|uniref:FLZ-type domain-containing protein n=1 Tax=Penstemon smallii TaxID=265156 RepID=A0ABD3SLJ4_9LAMI
MSSKKSKPVIEILTGSLLPKTIATSAQSPKGLKNFDHGGVGLAIVAAFEENIPANKALFSRNLSRSKPIPMKTSQNRGSSEEIEIESFEECTIVKNHDPNKSYTKVHNKSVFHISAERLGESTNFPPADFLNSCNLCHKKLKDKDIYMYRGEKAFCSTECRYSQIVMDERKEKCSSEAPSIMAVDVVSSTYDNGRMFTTGILAI